MLALIIGTNGQLGQELQRTKPVGWRIIACSRSELDIVDRAAVTRVLQREKPELVINTAAYTAVDRAESEKEKAFAVNADGAANLAKGVEDIQARLIHLSTDFVFDGTKSRPYLPGDKTNPLGVYGASKLQGEQAVAAATRNRALIIRTGWLYSSCGANFVLTMLRLMTERDELRVVADQVGTPTWTRGLAGAIYRIAELPDVQGIFHWSDAGVASWYDFAVAIQEEALRLEILNKKIPIKPIRTEDYPTPARRPAYSVLDKTTTWEILGRTAGHWRESLRRMLEEVKS